MVVNKVRNFIGGLPARYKATVTRDFRPNTDQLRKDIRNVTHGRPLDSEQMKIEDIGDQASKLHAEVTRRHLSLDPRDKVGLSKLEESQRDLIGHGIYTVKKQIAKKEATDLREKYSEKAKDFIDVKISSHNSRKHFSFSEAALDENKEIKYDAFKTLTELAKIQNFHLNRDKDPDWDANEEIVFRDATMKHTLPSNYFISPSELDNDDLYSAISKIDKSSAEDGQKRKIANGRLEKIFSILSEADETIKSKLDSTMTADEIQKHTEGLIDKLGDENMGFFGFDANLEVYHHALEKFFVNKFEEDDGFDLAQPDIKTEDFYRFIVNFRRVNEAKIKAAGLDLKELEAQNQV